MLVEINHVNNVPVSAEVKEDRPVLDLTELIKFIQLDLALAGIDPEAPRNITKAEIANTNIDDIKKRFTYQKRLS